MSTFSTKQTTQGRERRLPTRWNASDNESGTESDSDSDNEELYSDDDEGNDIAHDTNVDGKAANTTDTSRTAKVKKSTNHGQHHDLKELNSKDYELGSDSLLEKYVKGEDYKKSSTFEIMLGGNKSRRYLIIVITIIIGRTCFLQYRIGCFDYWFSSSWYS